MNANELSEIAAKARLKLGNKWWEVVTSLIEQLKEGMRTAAAKGCVGIRFVVHPKVVRHTGIRWGCADKKMSFLAQKIGGGFDRLTDLLHEGKLRYSVFSDMTHDMRDTETVIRVYWEPTTGRVMPVTMREPPQMNEVLARTEDGVRGRSTEYEEGDSDG